MRLLILSSFVLLITAQQPDPHTIQGCSNYNHPTAEVQDCQCQVRTTQKMDACDKKPETRVCATYCRKQHCHCSPICDDRGINHGIS
jgi:hypothetical protein